MLAKVGLILAVVVCGLLLFALGFSAPQSMRSRATVAASQLIAPHALAFQPGSKAGRKAILESDSKAGAKSDPQQTAAIPYQTLLVPTPPPTDATYALQLGLYPTLRSADATIRQVEDAGVATSAISVLDQNDDPWIVVAAGQYATADEARAARDSLAAVLAIATPLPIIRLPAKQAPPSTQTSQ